MPTVSQRRSKLVLYGQSFGSLAEVASRYCFSVNALRRHYRETSGDLEQAVFAALEDDTILFEGKSYSNLPALCSDYAIQSVTVYARIRHGYSLTDAVRTPVQQTNHGSICVYRDKAYDSQIALCREYGISCALVYYIAGHYQLPFTTAFDAVNSVREEIDFPSGCTMSCIPALVIHGEIYKARYEFLSQAGITEERLKAVKKELNCADDIEALRHLQASRLAVYLIHGQVRTVSFVEANYTPTEQQALSRFRVSLPVYPCLQDYDLSRDCFDGQALFRARLRQLCPDRTDRKRGRRPVR